MRLLVSVANAAEAVEAATGGAEIIDAKDPASGALGAVRPDVLSEVRASVEPGRLLTAALGDVGDREAATRMAREYTRRGAALVKLGFAGIGDEAEVEALVAAAVRGCEPRSGVVAVAYADADQVTAVDRMALVRIAARAGAKGVLLDTADKRGAGLTRLFTPAVLAAWVREAHAHGLLAALAGKLGADDLEIVRDAGADIAGVRGAACRGGRTGCVSAERVRSLLTPSPIGT